jgi:hypothetical protein
MCKAFKIAQSTLETLTTSGSVTLGDASGDALTINSSAVSIPNGLNFDSNTLVIDATNNRVGVGIATPAVSLDVYSPADAVMFNVRENTSGNGRRIRFSNAGAVNTIESTAGVGATNLAFTIDGTEAMRIDSSRNVGIGVSNPSGYSSKLVVLASAGGTTGVFTDNTNYTFAIKSGGSGVSLIGGEAGNSLAFQAGASERMRLDTSGNLLVGTTTNAAGHRIYSVITSSTAYPMLAQNSSTASSGVGTYSSNLGTGNAGNTNCFHFRGVTENVAIYYLYGNGTSSFTSDSRLKKNIEPARNGYLDDICKLNVVKYNWKNSEEGTPKELGLIAQQVEEVFAGLVQDADVEMNGITPKVLKASVLPFMLLKAIQEQQAIINDLKARIETLESK